MAGFQAVNASLTTEGHVHGPYTEATTPTTPRPNIPSTSTTQAQPAGRADESSPNTPTRDSFGGVSGQRPLPTESFAAPSTPQNTNGKRMSTDESFLTPQSSHRNSIHSRDSHDVDMDDSEDDQEESDDESLGGDPGRPSKKKKGQRFFCTDFPPCTLSFTRSEHLARHIRKHTGERPFQCHCARRFSRLDNLRQHAQTVHVNEDIPTDSLAATGTRFQRQVRTDRVRTPGSRSRASTVGSQSGHSRGHSRNLSTSSIGSAVSNMGARDDIRRRPPPLIMANEPSSRARLSIETFRSPPDSPGTRELHYRGYPTQSPGTLGTPTSATFSTGPGSPRFPSGMHSPSSTVSRPSNVWSPRASGRRLSVPSGANPFQSPHANPQAPPYFSPLTPSNGSTYSGHGSMFGSPTSSIFSNGNDLAARTAQEGEFKRRTWHPESRTTFNSPLANSSIAYQQSPVSRPVFPHSHSSGLGTRLPGIESFDQVNRRPNTPPRRGPSPMQIDMPLRPTAFSGLVERSTTGPDDRRGVPEWDMSLHRNLTRLDITTSTPPTETTAIWPQQARADPEPPTRQEQAFRAPQPHPHPPPGPTATAPTAPRPVSDRDSQGKSPETPRKSKRHGWYNGPIRPAAEVVAQRTSPEDSSSSEGVPTPSTSSIVDCNPSIVHSNGWVESNSGVTAVEPHHTYPVDGSHGGAYPLPQAGSNTTTVSQADTPKGEGDMGRLEALVAAATSEGKAT